VSDRAKVTRPSLSPAALQRTAGSPASDRAAAMLALQRSAGNSAVSGLMVQRQHVQTRSGHSVGDTTGAGANIREDVLAVQNQLAAIWSMNSAAYGAQRDLVASKPPGSSVPTGELGPTIAAIAENEKPLMAPPVVKRILRVDVSAAVGAGASPREDVVAVMEAMHRAGHLSNTAYDAAYKEVSAVEGATIPDSAIPSVLKGLVQAKTQAAIMTTARAAAGPTPAVGTSGPGAVGTPGVRTAGTPLVKQPKAADKFDAKARLLGAKDYDDFAHNMLVSGGSVVGRSVPSTTPVHPLFLDRLEAASAAAKEKLGEEDFGVDGLGGFRSRQGPHAFGLAVDLDVAKNPYVTGEAGDTGIDALTSPVYQRIATTLLGRDSVIPVANTGGLKKANYQKVAEESDAMVAYFSVLGAGPSRKAMSKHGAFTPEVLAGLDPAQVQADYDILIGNGVPKGAVKGDFPFKPNSMGGKISDPKGGFLTIREEIVVAMRAAKLRWGGTDFGNASGDIQHFDDSQGDGTAKQAYFDYGAAHPTDARKQEDF
jgi:hypothetical protein